MKTAITAREQFQRCWDAALRYLSSRPRSEAELRFKLRRRSFADETIARVLAELREQHLVDDFAFARFWRENREAFSPRSWRLVARELREKGVAAEIIVQAIAGLDDEVEARQAVQRKLRSLSGLPDPEFRQKLGSFLRRRGFDYEVIRDIIDRVCKEVGT